MKRTNWHELKNCHSSVIKIDELDSSALFLLYENSVRMCNESNNNVSIATVSPSSWFDDITNTIINNVSYVCKSANFHIFTFIGPEIMTSTYLCDLETFNSFEDMDKFIKDKSQFSTLVMFAIIKYVDLDNLTASWVVRYKQIVDQKQIRDNKIEYLIK